MIKGYIIWFITFVISFFGSILNSGLAVYDFYPDFLGGIFQTIFILILLAGVVYGVLKTLQCALRKWKVIHAFLMSSFAILSAKMILSVYIPLVIEMYEGSLNCALCP